MYKRKYVQSRLSFPSKRSRVSAPVSRKGVRNRRRGVVSRNRRTTYRRKRYSSRANASSRPSRAFARKVLFASSKLNIFTNDFALANDQVSGLKLNIFTSPTLPTADHQSIQNLITAQNVTNPVTVSSRYSYWLNCASMRFTFMNGSPASCHATFYYCMPRLNYTKAATTLHSEGFSEDGTITVASPASTPFMSSDFVQHNKIYRVTRRKLEQGQSHIITLSTRNRKIDNDIHNDFAHIKGYPFIMATFVGSLIADSASPNTISTAPLRILFRQEHRHSYRNMADPVSNNFQSSILPTVVAGNVKYVNQDIGDIGLGIGPANQV